MKEDDIKLRIEQLITELGQTPASFCKRTGISRPVLSHIINGRNKPSVQFLLQISEAFPEVSLDWLITGRSHSPTSKRKATKTTPTERTPVSNAVLSENAIQENINPKTIEVEKPYKSEVSVDNRIILIENGRYEILYPKN